MDQENNKKDIIFQTESLTAYKSTKKVQKSIQETNPIFIQYKDLKIGLVGFTKVFEPKTNKLSFAYKFKEDQKIILFHNVKGITDDKITKAKAFIQQVAKETGYTILDSSEYVKNIYNEKHRF